MSCFNLALNAIVASLAALPRCITQCHVKDEDDEHVQQVIRDGEDGINKMTIPMIVVTPPGGDPTLCIERATARANAPPSRIPVPKGGLTSAKRARHVLQAAILAREEVEKAVAETLVAMEDEQAYQQEIIANTIAGILESMRDDDLDDLDESEEGSAPSA